MSASLLCLNNLVKEAKKDKKRKRRTHSGVRKPFVSPFITVIDYLHMFRLTEELILDLLEDISPLFPTINRKGGLDNRIKLLSALSFFASGSYQKQAGIHLSQPSVSRAIRCVINALNNPVIVRKYIRFPQNKDERKDLTMRFFNKYKIPGVIGCIDATYVAMVRPKDNDGRFYCDDGCHARNILIINDCDYNILHVDATFGAATEENFIFNNSVIKEHLEELNNSGETVCLLGDSAYAQCACMMTPCIYTASGSPEEHYNDMHSAAHSSALHTIGLLKGRFRCLLPQKILHYHPDDVARIVIACCVLHNICNGAGLPAPSLSKDEQQELQASQKKLPVIQDGADMCRYPLIRQLWEARI